MTYIIWTGDGRGLDGAEYEEFDEALSALTEYRGYDTPILLEHCDGEAWSVYGTQEDADNDIHGPHADTITHIQV